MVIHLEEPCEKFVKNGKLLTVKETLFYSPNYAEEKLNDFELVKEWSAIYKRNKLVYYLLADENHNDNNCHIIFRLCFYNELQSCKKNKTGNNSTTTLNLFKMLEPNPKYAVF